MENERKTIMLVDDNMTNLASAKGILKDVYKVYPVLSGKILFTLLEKITPDMILLDIEMPEMDGFEVIKHLKRNSKWAEIPVMFLTATSDPEGERRGRSLGAIDYVLKPFSASSLLKRIEAHLRTA
jgi:putative two-component system response regulator